VARSEDDIANDAILRAENLLLNNLDAEQTTQFHWSEGNFVVKTPMGRYYLLSKQVNYGISLLSKCGPSYVSVVKLCALPEDYYDLPIYDIQFQLKSLLEAEGGEEIVVKKANVSPVSEYKIHKCNTCQSFLRDWWRWAEVIREGMDDD
jgi:hypothetical protein